MQDEHPADGKLEREAAIDRLTREMKEAAKLLEFEHAASCATDRPPAPGREPHCGFLGRDGAEAEPCTDTEKREKVPWQTIK